VRRDSRIAATPRTCRSRKIIEETRKHICDFDRLVQETATARELYDAMRALYPDRVDPGALWFFGACPQVPGLRWRPKDLTWGAIVIRHANDR